MKNTQITKECLYCGRKFNTQFYRIKDSRGKYCSRECYIRSQKGKPSSMKGKKHSEKTKDKMRKSLVGRIPWNKGLKGVQEAWNKGMRGYKAGKDNPNWQGGITPLNHQIRNCYKYRQWRSDVFTRDDFTCSDCSERGGRLEAHHYPKDFSFILKAYQITTLEQALECEELWNINNGLTLCEDCHSQTDNYKGQANK